MAAVDTPRSVDLVRTASQNSTLSNPRNRSLARVRPTKRASNASLSRSRSRAHSPAEDTKSLTSFPSLSPSPETSPVQARMNGWFRSASGLADDASRGAENKPVTSPETVRAIPPPDAGKSPAPATTVRKVTKSTQQIVGSLVATSSTRTRTALFDDTPQEPAKVPGNLHFSTDDNIEDALAQAGAVALVKQLAGDLAQRDAQITALRRRAEERERILRKMLQECEVSNMDIENRLRELERNKDQPNQLAHTRTRGDSALSGLHPDDPMEDRLARAMEDEVATHPDALGIDSGSAAPAADVASIHSIASEATRDPRRANWKSYIWTGASRNSSRAPSVASLIDRESETFPTQSRPRASSGAKPLSRKALANDLFVPPAADKGNGAVPALRRLQSHGRSPEPSSRRSSVSLASWALKMVAGNSQAGSKANTVRGRKHIDSGNADRTPSVNSTRTTQSARSSLANVQQRGRALGPNGTIKSTATETQKLVSKTTSPHPPSRGLSNLGPVEMDRILPEESRPPTLVQHHNRFTGSSEYLTDRFGFIYDQRRKKRQSEAAAALAKQKRNSNIESLGDSRSVFSRLGFEEETDGANPATSDVNEDPSRPSSSGSDDQSGKPVLKTWVDYLKLATHPTELLSHTPSAAPITSVESAEGETSAPKSSQITLTKRGSLPFSSANPEPSPSRIVSSFAELSIASPSIGPSMPVNQYPTSQADPVKSLLDQMSELHDNLQKERTVRWNEFLRKVRAERKREGDAGTGEGRPHAMPETLLTDGEMVGMASLGNKGKLGRAKWQEFRRLVLEGIPVAYRAKVWAECSGAAALRIPGYYEDLLDNGSDDPVIAAQIQMDITRTLTDNIFFRTGPGVAKLNEVLLAYSRRNPDVGYCQGMNLITACLLLILPTSEDAFWMLATMIETILPQNYYDAHLLTSRADQSVLRSYVVELLPRLSAHLDALEIELEALTFQWFLSVFTDCLSAEALFRVWDVVLCMHDGATFLFQIALALLKLNEKALLLCEAPAAVYHYINHQMTNHAISIDGLVQASDALGKVVKRRDVEERRERAVGLEKELMRQRDEARVERARKRGSVVEERGGVVSPPPTASSRDVQSSPVRSPGHGLDADADEDGEDDVFERELTERTPMPIEEECAWR
ncbi:TBC-domain-containing protein [Dothidotthia symphoricarpi CBS 119687]|uniref:TBC-domain-containing protein n=1 Tax=Dothidotthia symphoricarpi CBS 119687 TaxID=1392245 RepID=A0A6A6ALU2_9PLEO|nr:TBC-domain-containing protein [Dothidotthia symphoricarpi CBS 119687]KAF2131441.1 TBC-domain-containing protein [Dothidotthia symphoricarpi CBS 119687]